MVPRGTHRAAPAKPGALCRPTRPLPGLRRPRQPHRSCRRGLCSAAGTRGARAQPAAFGEEPRRAARADPVETVTGLTCSQA